jgi:hypothetical protein
MLKINAPAFVNALSFLAAMRASMVDKSLSGALEEKSGRIGEMESLLLESFQLMLGELKASLSVLSVPVTSSIVGEFDRSLKESVGSWGDVSKYLQEIEAILKRELEVAVLLSLDPREVSYFEPKSPLFGKEFADKFPTEAAYEIDEAGKCLALGRSTACVFHLMRAMEIGVRTTARCLGVPDPVKPAERNWGVVLKAIQDAIRTKWPNAAGRAHGDGALFEELYASLDAVRNPWRNATMHVEKKYTDEEAEHIFVAVRGFMKKLAARMDETGDPRA